ncbi:hypothetical protein AV521_21355 [Streptomyces sp. IMTB 2501]|nr:hypothetical protein AV521_21355 [Streptomyces sp. IMTB 2501]
MDIGARQSGTASPPSWRRYGKRNVVERAINRLKHFQAVVACYDKRRCVFHGTVTVAAIQIWLRA